MKKVILLLVLGISFQGIAQHNNKTKPLKEVLLRLEKQLDINFSFADDLIQDKRVKPYIVKKSLEANLANYQQQTKLVFKKVSKNHYAILPTPKNIKICGDITTLYNEELPNVSVQLLLAKKDIKVKQGRFKKNKVAINDTVQIQHIGYNTLKIPVSDFLFKNCKTFVLEEERNLLNEVFIVNYITNGISKNIDGSIVFKPKNQNIVSGLTEPDVLQTVQQLPGIISVDETASGLHVRGGTPDHNLVLFDNVRLFNTGHFFGAISAINPHIVDKVTVYKTASNTKYGNHISGVVDVTTADDIPEKIEGGAGFNFTHVDANIKVPINKKLSISTSGRRSISDLISTPTFERLSDKVFQHSAVSDGISAAKDHKTETNNTYVFYDYSAKVNYKPSEKDKISASYIKINNEFNYEFDNLDLKENRKDDLLVDNFGGNINWDRTWSENLKQTTSLSYSDYSLKYDNQQTSEDFTDYASLDKDNKIKNINFSTNITMNLNEVSKINAGYQFVHDEVAYSLIRKNDLLYVGEKVTEDININNSHTIFSEYVLDIPNKFSISAGTRVSHMSSLNKFTFEPRIFAKTKIVPNLFVTGSFEIKQQQLSKILEFDTIDFGLENQLWALSDKDTIPLLESKQYTVGLLYKKDNWVLDLDLYQRNIDGLTTLTTGFDSFIQEIYTGSAVTRGLDFLAKKTWRNYNIWLSYNTGTTSFLFDQLNNGKEFSGNFDVSHSFYIANNITFKPFTFSVGWTYRVGVPFSSNNGLNDNLGIDRNGINDTRLPDYHRMDITATYDFNISKKIKSKIGLSLLNVYDQENILRRQYETKPSSDWDRVLIKNDTKSQGFTPNFFFRVNF